MTPKEIAEKYVYGTHDALTQKQEVIDMIADIENYAKTVGNSDIISSVSKCEKCTPLEYYKEDGLRYYHCKRCRTEM